MDLVELTGMCVACSPNTVWMAWISIRSIGRRGGAVGVDIVHLGRRYAGIGQGGVHGAGPAAAGGVGCGHVIGIAADPAAEDLGVNPGLAPARVGQGFEDQNARAFTQGHALAITIERTCNSRDPQPEGR